MDQQIVPIRFYKGINSYWRRRRYQKVESTAPAKGTKATLSSRLGGAGGSGGRWFMRLRRRIGKTRFRFRIRIPSLVNIVTRVRDAYVDWMLSAAGKTPAAITGSDAWSWSKRIPKSGPAKTSSSAFERRLMFEIYNSLVVAGEIKPK
ncbi:uncharacterized protein LOC141824146 [Curcuma longa]|uniref:uncharacterized protein LOC141824146 n=1 Tax=Curcuma longa TaxID=136217 RepID=UPI003D9EAB72